MIRMTMLGAMDVMQRLERIRGEVGTKTETSLEKSASWAQRAVKVLAPVDTGAYRDSIMLEQVGPTHFEIYSDAPYGARLEYGFDGVDSLGRRVSQAPRPHWGPVADVLPGYVVTQLSQELEYL